MLCWSRGGQLRTTKSSTPVCTSHTHTTGASGGGHCLPAEFCVCVYLMPSASSRFARTPQPPDADAALLLRMCAWGVHDQQTQEAQGWLLLTLRREPHLSQLALQLCDLFHQVLPLIFRGHMLEAAEVLWEAVVNRGKMSQQQVCRVPTVEFCDTATAPGPPKPEQGRGLVYAPRCSAAAATAAAAMCVGPPKAFVLANNKGACPTTTHSPHPAARSVAGPCLC